jgi:hypothetical protein
VPQFGTLGQDGDEGSETLGRRHEKPHVAVAQDVADLFRLEQRIEGDENASRFRGAEARDHGLDALVEVDADAIERRSPCPSTPEAKASIR